MNKITTLILKEWADAFRNRYVLFIVGLMPLIMVALPIIMLTVGSNPANLNGGNSEIPAAIMNQPGFQGLSTQEALQAFLGMQFNVYFLILPLAIPMTIATYSIVGEKRDRSLEPLLAAPISTAQLLAGKAIAAAGPGIIAAWVSAIVYTIALQFVVSSQAVRDLLLSGPFLVSVLIIAPLLTILATTVGLSVSSRVNDPRVAEQLGMIVIVPVLGLVFAQIAGIVAYDMNTVLISAAVLVVADLALLYVAVRLFQRETILTRWK